MLIRSNSLSEVTKTRLMNGGTLPDSMAPPPLTGIQKTAPVSSVKQNAYENVFIKVFAQSMLYLITVFALLLSLLLVVRELIGFRLGFLKLSFWLQTGFNLTLFALLIFARVKVLTVNLNVTVIPLENVFNRDHAVLLSLWTLAAWNFGSWYLNHYAPKLFVLFSQIKGKAPVLREEFFLLTSVLVLQGLVAFVLALRRGELDYKLKRHHEVHHYSHLPFHQLILKTLQNQHFWIRIVKQSALVYPLLLIVHVVVAWFAFPAFGWFLSGLFPIQQPIRHSWLVLFRFSLLFHAFSLSLLLNLIDALAELCIDYFLTVSKLAASTFVPKSEQCLTEGISKSRHPFIHLAAVCELKALVSGKDAVRRRKLFAEVEEEGSMSRQICDWFVAELNRVSQHAATDLAELKALRDELSAPVETNENNTLIRNRWIEKISKRLFTTNVPQPTEVTASLSAPIPEIFAKRGNTSIQSSTTTQSTPIKPLILDFAPLLLKYRMGRQVLSLWVASRKTHGIARFGYLLNAVSAMGGFIATSFEEDVTGQVQMVLPRVLETILSTLDALNSLQQVEFEFEASEAAARLANMNHEIVETIRLIVRTFGASFDDLRISSQSRDRIKQLI